MIIGRDLLGELELDIIMNFNDQKVTWDTETFPMKDRGTLSSTQTLIDVYLRENEPQTLTDEYSCDTKILDAEYKPASLDDVIRTCEDLHVEGKHQLKESLQKY